MDKKVLILAAGKGTRMGPLGEVLPKPLWPLFKSTLLETQIKLWKSRGVSEIFVNASHKIDMMESYLKKHYPEVTFVPEEKLLDVGGAVHNVASLASVNYSGFLWVSNVDVFVFPKLIENFEKKILESGDTRACLSLVKVKRNSTYTNVCLGSDGEVTRFEKGVDSHQDYWTYSGLSLINLNGMKKVQGVSKFFESVCNFKKEKVLGLNDESLEYWDFGTIDLYYSSLYRLMTEHCSQLHNFLNEHNIYNETLVV